ncbi:MAG: AlbA family DNA-binding domain-containing protein [Actinomycetes bacterium]
MTPNGQRPRDEVVTSIEAHDRLWVRLAAVRNGDAWQTALLEIVTGEQPPRWSEQRWEYEDVTFSAWTGGGDTVAKWLRQGTLTEGARTIQLPDIAEHLRYERSQSLAPTGFEILSWPLTRFHLSSQPLTRHTYSEPLIGPDAPSFVSFDSAAAAFFGVHLGPRPSMNGQRASFHQQDRSGRILHVRIRTADLEVTLEGQCLDSSMVVELASNTPGPRKVVEPASPQVVHFPLPDGMPPGSWIVLRRGTDWVDRKFLNWPNTITGDPGVEEIIEPGTRLQTLVTAGEGAQVEFKRELPPTGRKGDRGFLRTVAAFANGDGGSILFGVDDEGTLVGISKAEAPMTRDTITNLVRNVVTPLPSFSLELVDGECGEDRVILILWVEAGSAPSYGTEPGNPSYYVRRGATTFSASAEHARALARSRPAIADTANHAPVPWPHPPA